MVDCAKDVLKQHCCWPIVSDLINVLSHKPIAYKFMQDERLLHFWFDLLSCFQGNVDFLKLNDRDIFLSKNLSQLSLQWVVRQKPFHLACRCFILLSSFMPPCPFRLCLSISTWVSSRALHLHLCYCYYMWPMEPAKQVPNGRGTMPQQHA